MSRIAAGTLPLPVLPRPIGQRGPRRLAGSIMDRAKLIRRMIEKLRSYRQRKLVIC